MAVRAAAELNFISELEGWSALPLPAGTFFAFFSPYRGGLGCTKGLETSPQVGGPGAPIFFSG